ncbi:MAG: hypothetical protein KGM24_10185 [Elusimicrobia bacterium]|nr:hypothetical protein [Elusimicrobiota bacterium]
MNKMRLRRIARRLGAFGLAMTGILAAVWVLPPVVHRARRLCPVVHPDSVTAAGAVPSYARQTGMSCSACHTIFPELTPFGREFKLNGYTMTNTKQIEADASSSAPALKFNALAPLSVMFQTSLTHYNGVANHKENNGVVLGPLSLFYAGEISQHTGTFLQVTMADSGSNFGFDTVDLRYANQATLSGVPVTYGLALDNAGTAEDLWNSTPHWGYPYMDAFPGRGDGPAVASLSGAAPGAYAMVDNHVYAYVGVYRQPTGKSILMTDNTSGNTPVTSTGTVHAWSPYWRLAWQGNLGNDDNYLEVGTFGTNVRVYGTFTNADADVAAGLSQGNSDDFTDNAVDAQYELHLGSNMLVAHASDIYEAQKLNAAVAAGAVTDSVQHVNRINADVGYILGNRWEVRGAYFTTTGTHDAYAFTGTGDGFPNGGDGTVASVNQDGYIAQVDFLPTQNTKLSAQYTAYNKYGGLVDGASINNALVINAWWMF